uniref:Uncharacterized protein n=1 Tax=Grammatophora oceanica TaxID=210454 RepID=A0A7S1YMK9_9STRA|mmetsp:Transcript_6548/g.9553  ORF Transcript_6548/g.9553 Transcript_6548/m.9553 type:complete len:270 (+) Transcript_6548:70-879(+)|eukprot:CAMPEP_0194039026 /NCGR_PEP_ID=MMETSP0009_2-20130614/11217_1 /TAXON_ID=210454 /ORGANISM="Grammatophora oceanica, Strain CCMP 410" /LENGTH=269 /DNA_ID=CAMNT_0038681727 /DNA_START=61 /DNA_END=870 /DNA_ORIENTATION=+
MPALRDELASRRSLLETAADDERNYDQHQHAYSPPQREVRQSASSPSTFRSATTRTTPDFGGVFRRMGTRFVQNLNLARLIDEMEHDQELADHLEVINMETQEEKERKLLVQEARTATLRFLEKHLMDFKEERRRVVQQQQEEEAGDDNDSTTGERVAVVPPPVTYEEWIADLHPENAYPAMVADKAVVRRPSSAPIEIDHRFYVQEADHRKLWNKLADDEHQIVPARSKMLRGMGVTEAVGDHHQLELEKKESQQTVVSSDEEEDDDE